jgi:hypothetical protein
MPYEDEYASYRSLRRIAESEQVQQLLQRTRINQHTKAPVPLSPLALADIAPTPWMPNYVLAVDGSNAEEPVNNGYPLAALGYVTVASVMLDMHKMQELDEHRPIDPRKFRTLESIESIDGALPGSNVVIEGEDSAEASFRRALFELFESKRMAEQGETLLETYEALLARKPDDAQKPQRCPYGEESCLHPQLVYPRGQGEYQCPCMLRRSLFSTDALRIHEFMQPSGSNQSVFTETMSVLERVWIIHILRTLEKRGWLPILKRLAIVLDGPLAVFGSPAWLSSAIYDELRRINGEARRALRDPSFNILLLGIEKSGAFVQHLNDLDKGPRGEMNALPRQSAWLLTDQYIKRHIIYSDSERDYGRNTYFGRKIFYKSSSGALIVANLPFLQEDHRDLKRAEPSQFPRLGNAMHLLDKLVSAQYRNSVTALIRAHAEAAIPLHLGSKVLEKLARQMMQPRLP